MTDSSQEEEADEEEEEDTRGGGRDDGGERHGKKKKRGRKGPKFDTNEDETVRQGKVSRCTAAIAAAAVWNVNRRSSILMSWRMA